MLVNKAELARVFGVSAPTVDRWIVDGCPIVKGGSNGVAYEFDTDQVKDLKDRREADDKRQAEEREQEIRRIQSEMFAERLVRGKHFRLDAPDFLLAFLRLALVVGFAPVFPVLHLVGVELVGHAVAAALHDRADVDDPAVYRGRADAEHARQLGLVDQHATSTRTRKIDDFEKGKNHNPDAGRITRRRAL